MNWFCIYTAISGEFKALEALQSKQLQCYLPVMVMGIRRGGRVVERRAPLLARYLFVMTAMDQLVSCVHDVNGICEILPHEQDPYPVCAVEIEQLQAREAAGEFVFKPTASDRRRHRKVLRSFAELAIFGEQAQTHAN